MNTKTFKINNREGETLREVIIDLLLGAVIVLASIGFITVTIAIFQLLGWL